MVYHKGENEEKKNRRGGTEGKQGGANMKCINLVGIS